MAPRETCPECGEPKRSDHMWGCPNRSKARSAADSTATSAPAAEAHEEVENDEPDLEQLQEDAQRYVSRGKYRQAQSALDQLRALQPGLARAAWFIALEEEIEFSDVPASAAETSGGGAGESAATRRRWRPLPVVVGILAFFALSFAGLSHMAGAQRRLHVLNATPWPATIRVEGIDRDLLVEPQGHESLVVGEGRHRVTVTHQQGSRTHDVVLETGFLTRMSTNSAFVLNVEGAAALLWEEEIYTNVPNTQTRPRPPRVESGAPFTAFHDVDYIFRPLPKQTTVKAGRATDKRLSQLTFLRGTPTEVVSRFPANVDSDTVLSYLELHLRLDPSDAESRRTYRDVGTARGAGQRVARFLQGLGSGG